MPVLGDHARRCTSRVCARGADESLAVEDLRRGHADAVRADRAAGAQREVGAPRARRCRCTAVSVFMNTNSVRVQRGADAIGANRPPSPVAGRCRRLRVHQRHQRAQPHLGRLPGRRWLACANSPSPDSPARPPRRGRSVSDSPSHEWWDVDRWRRRRVSLVRQQPGADTGHRSRRPVGAVGDHLGGHQRDPVARPFHPRPNPHRRQRGWRQGCPASGGRSAAGTWVSLRGPRWPWSERQRR